MKYIYSLLLGTLLFVGIGCEDDIDNDPQFDTTLPSFVEFSSASSFEEIDSGITMIDIPVTIQLREVRSTPVTVDYSVVSDVVGSVSTGGTSTIPAFELTTSAIVSISGGAIEGGSATVAITAVDNGLTIGRQNSSSATEHVLSWAREE